MSGEKITARLRTERDLSNGKERIQVYEVGRYLVIIRGDRKSTGQRLHVEIHYGDNHDERVEKEGSYLPYLYTHVRLAAKWNLDALPTDEEFLAAFKNDEEEEETPTF